jgi:hypothetical protein
MSEKPADDAKEKPDEAKGKSTEAKEKPDEAKGKSTEAKKKPDEAKGKSTEAKKKPDEAKEKATKDKEKPAEGKDKSAETKEAPAEAKEKPVETKGKPLEKMTVKDLREIAKEIPSVTGVHGMKKEELIVAIQDAKGIKAAPVKKADATIAVLKKKIKALKIERQAALEAKDRKMATIYKRRISRLKKKTRRAAA